MLKATQEEREKGCIARRMRYEEGGVILRGKGGRSRPINRPSDGLISRLDDHFVLGGCNARSMAILTCDIAYFCGRATAHTGS